MVKHLAKLICYESAMGKTMLPLFERVVEIEIYFYSLLPFQLQTIFQMVTR